MESPGVFRGALANPTWISRGQPPQIPLVNPVKEEWLGGRARVRKCGGCRGLRGNSLVWGGDLGPGLGCCHEPLQEPMKRPWTGGKRESKERAAGENTTKRLQGGQLVMARRAGE